MRNKVRREIFKAEKEHRSRVQRHKKAYPGEWYKQIKLIANLGNDETTILPPPGIDVNDFEGVANSINDIFASVSKDLEPLDTTKLPAYLPDSKPCPTVKEFEVFQMLNKVKVGKAGGPDGISARLIKEFSYELSKPLTDILNQSYREGTVPSQWKKAVESNIDPNQYGNMKGVSTSHYLMRLMDTLLKNSDKPGHISSDVITDFSKVFDLVDHN